MTGTVRCASGLEIPLLRRSYTPIFPTKRPKRPGIEHDGKCMPPRPSDSSVADENSESNVLLDARAELNCPVAELAKVR
jgi:hypothetical protein